jgi:energy-coupling factor transporter ATP-binding protein EcfA2
MTETTSNINLGITEGGEKINWRNLNNERNDDPTITALVEEAKHLFNISINKQEVSTSIIDKDKINMFIKAFNEYLKKNKYNKKFTEIELRAEVDNNKKKKPQKLSKKEIILQNLKEERCGDEINNLLNSFQIQNNVPYLIKKPIESFFNVLNWAIYLLSKKKYNIDLLIYFDCAISLYRAINDSLLFLPPSFINESYEVLNELEEFFYSKINGTHFFNFISKNMQFILDSMWDKYKPVPISLYNEQKEILSLVSSNLNEKKLIFFEMPPANGKTVLSAILAIIIEHVNKKNLIIYPGYNKKILLYICYNSIVRNEVAKLCTTHNVDVKYWLAVRQQDAEDGTIKTFLRPYKTCYVDWNKKVRSKKEEKEHMDEKWKKFSENIHDQWDFFVKETCNTPGMIISDLDSAYELMNNFPGMFIAYFDEAFACAELEITSKIMSVMEFAVLVSATLAKPSEIPTVINHFKTKNNLENDNFLHYIKSTKQHISCTFIDNNGYVFPPHDICEDMDQLKDFVKTINVPLIKRGYSPEVVFDMSTKIDHLLPTSLKFKSIFKYLGMLTHESIREYGCSIIKHITETSSYELFDNLKLNRLKKIDNMDVNTIFTNSAIYYQGNKTLHIASSDNFNVHVENIARDFLRNSPKISDAIDQYTKETENIKSRLKHFEKNGTKDTIDEKIELEHILSNLTFKWPSAYLMNSKAHATKFSNISKLNYPNDEIFGSIKDLEILDDTRTKLFLSGIGVYQPETFTKVKTELFLKHIKNFKFILSTPPIVYGTNISLSIVDIDSSFTPECSKNTLYQLIGRAGRKGRSSSASIIFRDRNMLNVIFENNNINNEAVSIERIFNLIIN